MLGCVLVILWLTIFSIVSYLCCSFLGLKTALLRTIFVWTFCMVFVGIFELLLLFYHEYLHKKGQYYYKKNICYWNEDNKISDMFSYKMYMDLYADYSLSDKRYCKKITNKGNRFVLLGELTHGFFCFLFAPIIFYYFIHFDELYIYLYSIMFVAIQFGLIIWYIFRIIPFISLTVEFGASFCNLLSVYNSFVVSIISFNEVIIDEISFFLIF